MSSIPPFLLAPPFLLFAMSGLEAIAVIGVVASLITAFKDSNSIANAIKQRRKSKPGALPPTVELEEALTAGEQEIQKAAAEGIRRWGQNWVDDEVDAKVALQEIVIEVQASMLKDLSIAVQDDNITDASSPFSIRSKFPRMWAQVVFAENPCARMTLNCGNRG